MALGRSSSNITQVGSGKLMGFAINSTGSRTSAVLQFPWIADSTFTDETAQDEITTEGSTKFTTDGVRTATFECTGLQRDIDSLNLLYSTYRGQRMTLVKEINENPLDSKVNLMVIHNAKVTPNLSLQGTGGQVTYSFTVENPGSSFSSVDLSVFPAGSFTTAVTGTVTPADGKYMQFKEITVS